MFVVTVSNSGPGAASDVFVNDALNGVSYVGSDQAYASGSGDWSIGDLAANSAETLTITVKVDHAACFTNTVRIVHSSLPDSNPANDSMSVPYCVGPACSQTNADLSVRKDVVPNPAPVGNEFTFIVMVSNAGPCAASGVVVNDLLNGVQYVDYSSQYPFDPTTGDWTVGDLPAHASPSLVITVRVDQAACFTNRVNISHANEPDPYLGNNTAAVRYCVGSTPSPSNADLRVTKKVEPNPPSMDQFTVIVTVSNLGPASASGIVVHEPLNGSQHVSHSREDAYDPGTGDWMVRDLSAQSSDTLIITAKVDQAACFTNFVRISHANEPDPNLANNTTGVRYCVLTNADLSIIKTVNPPSPVAGDAFTYTITVSNRGPGTAHEVLVQEQMPSSSTYQSDTSSGDYDVASGRWNVGRLNSGGVSTIVITVTSSQTNCFTNAVSAVNGSEADGNPGNNQARVRYCVQPQAP